jgi:hypothetical protein
MIKPTFWQASTAMTRRERAPHEFQCGRADQRKRSDCSRQSHQSGDIILLHNRSGQRLSAAIVDAFSRSNDKTRTSGEQMVGWPVISQGINATKCDDGFLNIDALTANGLLPSRVLSLSAISASPGECLYFRLQRFIWSWRFAQNFRTTAANAVNHIIPLGSLDEKQTEPSRLPEKLKPERSS